MHKSVRAPKSPCFQNKSCCSLKYNFLKAELQSHTVLQKQSAPVAISLVIPVNNVPHYSFIHTVAFADLPPPLFTNDILTSCRAFRI
jgi:hypothetical protein